MNIVGECFNNKITEQITKRQEIYGSINRSNEELTYLNTRTGWCKLVSSVDVNTNVDNIRNLKLNGSELARNYVLFGGSSIESRFGEKNIFESIPREGISTVNSINNPNAYGLGETEFGLKPMPGIKSATIKTETRGSIKRATVQIQANNRTQFDIIDLLYLRIGYSVLLEWGNSSYFENGIDGKYQTDINNSLSEAFLYKGNYTYTDENNNTKTVEVNYETILDIIQSKRLTSCGNYDALFAKVVNFNWTFTKEGTYDITINLISLGDVIESLKTNVLLGYEYNNTSPPQQNTGSAVVAYKDSNEISKFFYQQQSILASFPTGSGNHFGVLKLPNPDDANDTVFFRQEFENSQFQYYIRLGYMLEWIQKNLIYNIDNNPSLKILKIDYDVPTNIIHILRNQTTSDPRICIWNQAFGYEPDFENPTYYFAAETNDAQYYIDTNNNGEFDENENKYIKIMDTYFNLDYIISKINSLSSSDKEGKVSLYDLLNIFCKGWNNATGNYNELEPVIDTEKNIIRIVDKVTLPDRDNILTQLNNDYNLKAVTTPAIFNIYRYTEEYSYREYDDDGNLLSSIYIPPSSGFIKDLSFNTTVSPRLATMMTVGSTNQGYVVGQDSTALSRMNNGLTDRFKNTINSTKASFTEQLPPLSQQYQSSLQAYDNFIKTVTFKEYSGYHQYDRKPILDVESINAFSQTQKQFNEYQQARSSVNITSSSPNIGFLPFDLSLTMDGISGMKVYQKFEIDSNFLPTNYPDTLEFLIKGITHTIQNNVWNTTIESMAIPKNPFGSTAETRPENTATVEESVEESNTGYTIQSNTNTPLLIKAVTDQATYVFNSRGENSLFCANYSFCIAYKIKDHIDRRSNTAITFNGGFGRENANVPSGGNADTNAHRQKIKSLGIYEEEQYIGRLTPNEIKQWISDNRFNYGDIINYFDPDHLYVNGKYTNAHTQIYTGTLYENEGSKGWTSSKKANYTFTMVYPNSSYRYKLYYFKIKSEYLTIT
jgi:hypothetical protein